MERSDVSKLSPIERYLVDIVSQIVRRDLDEDWGPWSKRDARDASGLRVDVTFEEHGVALELTSLQDPEWLAANSEARKVEAQLTAFVRERGLTGWAVGVSSKASLKGIATAVMPMMERDCEITPLDYRSRDLADAEAKGELTEFLDHHRRLDQLGLSLLRRRPNSDEVLLMVTGAGFQILGFTDLLGEVVRNNAAKLGEARPRETHLAVLVARWDLSDAPSETAPPALPEDVDVLWVVHPERGSTAVLVWMVQRGDDNWRLITSVDREP